MSEPRTRLLRDADGIQRDALPVDGVFDYTAGLRVDAHSLLFRRVDSYTPLDTALIFRHLYASRGLSKERSRPLKIRS